MIWNAIMKIVWFIFVQGPLNLIAAFTKVLEYLTGSIINDILFGSEKEFSWSNIPMQFWWFVVVAFCLFSLVFTIQMVILMFKEAIETKSKFVLAIKNGVKAFAFMFLIPIFFFLANFIIQNLATTLINNFGDNSNIAQYLWHIGDSTWDGSAGNVPTNYCYPENISDYNILAQMFGSWFMLFAIFMIGIILVQKIIELFFLFIISPIVMIVMVIDEGRAAFIWKDMVVAKFLASSTTLIGYYIFISVTQILLSSGLEGLNASDFSKSLFIILFLCGGGMATIAFSDIVAHFVGESVGLKEGMSSLKTTLAGGMMAMGATKAVVKFKNRKIKHGSYSGSDSNNLASGGDRADSDFSSLSGAQASQVRGLNFSSFRSASSGLSSRSGIVGLASIALGASAIGVAKFNAGQKLGGVRLAMSNVGSAIAKATVKPFKKITRNLNPKLIAYTKNRTNFETQNLALRQFTKNQRKINLQKQKLNHASISPKSIKKITKKITKLEKQQKATQNLDLKKDQKK